MDEFSNEEKQRLDQLYGNDFKDITPDDAQLIARYEAWKAVNESKHKAEIESIKAETAIRIENARKQSEYALSTLKELRDRARNRYERVNDGKKEQA